MRPIWEKIKMHWLALLALLVLIIGTALLLASPVTPDAFEVVEGYPLPRNIYSEIDFETLDYEKSEAAGKLAEEKTPRCFRLDLQKMTQTIRKIDELLVKLKRAAQQADTGVTIESAEPAVELTESEEKAIRLLVKTEHLDVLGEAWKGSVRFGILGQKQQEPLGANEKLFVTHSDGTVRDTPVEHTQYYRKEALAKKMLCDIYEDRISDSEMKNSKLPAYFNDIITENLFPDNVLTMIHRDAAVEKAKVYRKILTGQLLLARTNALTKEEVQLYQSYREKLSADLQRGSSGAVVLYRLCVALALLFFMGLYMYHQYPEIATNARAVWLWCGVILLCLLMFRVIAAGFFLLADFGGIPHWTVFLVLPLAVPSLLISVIYGYRPAIYIGIFVSGIAACTLNNPFAVLMTGVLVSAIAAFMVRSVIHYKQFFVRAILVCTAATALCSVIFAGNYAFSSAPPEALASKQQQLMEQVDENGKKADEGAGKIFGVQVIIPATGEVAPLFKFRICTIFFGLLLIPAISGLVTVSLAQLLLFMLESCFRVTSSMTYLSYTDRNHKLLKELQISAPGTYHHCERVALLAENAADAIGLDRVRVQACALFHDVGKLKYPNMFTENNAPGEENMHRNFAPLQSVNIIKEHVAYGMELGKKYKLPPLLLRAIQSHHGTDFISFFYANAQREAVTAGLPEPDEKDFHYDGPLAVDKEVVLIMLADCCEAAVQSIPELTKEKVYDMVNMLFEKKQKGGQLEATAFTLKELHTVQKVFVDSLISMHNKRIAYPDQGRHNTKKQKGGKNT